jgi:hypothetical protein
VTPPPHTFKEREDINTRAFIDWAKAEFKGVRDAIVDLDKAVSNLEVENKHTITWPKLFVLSAGVIGLCLGVTWRGVDRAEAARDKALDAKAAMFEAHSKTQIELIEARNALMRHAEQDAKTKAAKK